jgi:hypothetical protein
MDIIPIMGNYNCEDSRTTLDLRSGSLWPQSAAVSKAKETFIPTGVAKLTSLRFQDERLRQVSLRESVATERETAVNKHGNNETRLSLCASWLLPFAWHLFCISR